MEQSRGAEKERGVGGRGGYPSHERMQVHAAATRGQSGGQRRTHDGAMRKRETRGGTRGSKKRKLARRQNKNQKEASETAEKNA